MPLQAPFNFDFTAGDLLYGLSPMRNRLVIRLGVQIAEAQAPATVDQYRKGMMGQQSKTVRKDWKNFLRENERHPRYARYMNHIRSFDNDEEAFAQIASSVKANDAWRAKSKFGMEWTIRNGRGHIHFILDGIDMGAVVTKTHCYQDDQQNILAQDLPRGKARRGVDKERTITHSELRWIYRNRGNPQVQNRVQFWRTNRNDNVVPCQAPWDNVVEDVTMPSGKIIKWRNAWLLYKPTREPVVF
ncbi:hypothetical protein MAH1_04180 [Sessilibacter sp. MAH1]